MWCCRLFVLSNTLGNVACGSGFCVLSEVEEETDDQRKKRRLNYQFRDALNSMSVAVQAGYSVENAVSACVRDLEQLYPKNEDIVAEFRYIETQQRVSVPVEELFLDLGQRCKVEDIENFASVCIQQKRSGGDLGNVIQKVARMLGDKIDVKKKKLKRLWLRRSRNR